MLESPDTCPERDFFIDNLLVRIHFIIVMIRWTGLAPWEFEFPFLGSLTSTFLYTCPTTPPHNHLVDFVRELVTLPYGSAYTNATFLFFFITLKPRVERYTKSMRLKYEPIVTQTSADDPTRGLRVERESSLNLCRRTVNLRRPERARNEGTTGPQGLDDTRFTTSKRRINFSPRTVRQQVGNLQLETHHLHLGRRRSSPLSRCSFFFFITLKPRVE